MKKSEKSDESGEELVASIARMMNLPRLTASVRNNEEDDGAPAAKKPSHRST
jgi:hypothetical protein